MNTTTGARKDGLTRLLRAARSMTTLHRVVLGTLLAFGALNAFGGGIYGMTGAPAVPVTWLANTPFRDYTIPSAILFFVVGGAFLFAAIAIFARARFAHVAAIGAAIVVLGWIAVQVMMIGYVSWMQPVTAIVGTVILLLAVRGQVGRA